MSFASEIFRGRTILERGIGWILIYRSFYGLINGIHLATGGAAGRPPPTARRIAVSALFYTNRCPPCAIISTRTPLKVLIEKALCSFIVREQCYTVFHAAAGALNLDTSALSPRRDEQAH